VEELHDALAGETESYRQLIALSRRERTALEEKNLTNLAEVVRQKEDILDGLARREKARERIVSRLSLEMTLPDSASLSDIISVLEGPTAQKMAYLRQKLSGVVQQLLSLNHGNHLLLQSEADHVDATFDYLMSCALIEDGHYTSEGSSHSQPTRGNILNWEV